MIICLSIFVIFKHVSTLGGGGSEEVDFAVQTQRKDEKNKKKLSVSAKTQSSSKAASLARRASGPMGNRGLVFPSSMSSFFVYSSRICRCSAHSLSCWRSSHFRLCWSTSTETAADCGRQMGTGGLSPVHPFLLGGRRIVFAVLARLASADKVESKGMKILRGCMSEWTWHSWMNKSLAMVKCFPQPSYLQANKAGVAVRGRCCLALLPPPLLLACIWLAPV